MKRKIKLYLIAVVALGIYSMSASHSFMMTFRNKWNNEKRPEVLKMDKQGDLYGLSYLSKYRIEGAGSYAVADKQPVEKKDGKIYIMGDSYLAKMFLDDTSSNLYKTEPAVFFWFGLKTKKAPPIHLQKDKKNILLIEMSERFIRDRFTSPAMVKSITECFSPNGEGKNKKTSPLKWRIVPETIEQNIGTLLFGYQLFRPVKEAKANFVYNTFNRCDPQVFVSEKRKRLYLSNTIDTLETTSSFKYIPEKEIELIVKNINAVSAHYHAIGFDEVVFTFIPNAATVCNPVSYSYNQLIPRIQSSENLKADFINVYDTFRAAPEPCNLYWKGDTHWNVNGYAVWEGLMNEYLKSGYDNQ